MGRYPTRFQSKTLWSAVTGVAILVLGALVVGLLWLSGTIFGFLQPVLVPLAVAGIIAYLLDPVVVWLERRKLSRLTAVLVVFGALLAAMFLLLVAILPAVQQGRQLVGRVIGGKGSGAAVSPQGEERQITRQVAAFLERVRKEHQGDPLGWLLDGTSAAAGTVPAAADAETDPLAPFWDSRGGRWLVEYREDLLSLGRRWVSAGTGKVFGFIGLAIGFLMVPVYLFFFLKEAAAIREHWHDFVPLRASRFKTELVETLQEINGYLISFFRGQVLVAFIDGILVGLALTFYGLPYGFLIGVFMAGLGVIPYVGNLVCLVPACVIGWFHAQAAAPFGLPPWGYVAGVLVIFVVVQQINSWVTAPKIVGGSVGLHPMTVIFSMLFWSVVLGGFLGALVAVPLTASIKVLFRRYIWQRQLLVAREEPAAGDEEEAASGKQGVAGGR